MNEMTVTSAQYVQGHNNTNNGVKATIDGVSYIVPLDPANRHYAEIMRQVDAGELTIADAE